MGDRFCLRAIKLTLLAVFVIAHSFGVFLFYITSDRLDECKDVKNRKMLLLCLILSLFKGLIHLTGFVFLNNNKTKELPHIINTCK